MGKSTIHRWWPSKEALVLDATAAHVDPRPLPESGDLRADLRSAVRLAVERFGDTVAGIAIPALAADLYQAPELTEALRERFVRPRRAALAQVVDRAVELGQLAPGIDPGLLFDAISGTVFYRALISGEPLDQGFSDRLVDLLLRGASSVRPATR